MKFKEIEFKDKKSEQIYKDYIKKVRKAIKILNKDSQQEILLEINSHIYEGVANSSKTKKEVENILDVLKKLGQPEIFLKSLVAEKKLDEATKTFNPIKVAMALILNISNGVSYIIFGILYLFLFSFIFLIIAKIINPENVGFFFHSSENFVLGSYTDSNGSSCTQYEKLGVWFIPIMLLLASTLYILLTLALRLKKTLKKKLS